MLNPVDTDAVIRDGGAVGRFPGEIHAGVAWWLGASFVALTAAEQLVVGSDGGPVTAEFFRRLCRGAVNAHHHACRVTAIDCIAEDAFLAYVRSRRPLASGYVAATRGRDGTYVIRIRLYDAGGLMLQEDTGLAAIRRMIAEDRVPIPVSDSARGTIEHRSPTAGGKRVIDAAEIIRTQTSILFVTLDSLRYDTALTAYDHGLTPHLASLLPDDGWERRQTPGTFTLPAHMAFFSGFLPKLPQPEQPPRLWECRPPAFKTVPPQTFVFDAPNLLTGLAYADAHLARLITTLTAKRRWLVILCADHGDAYGEDGYHGRGVAHPVVMNVPYAAMAR